MKLSLLKNLAERGNKKAIERLKKLNRQKKVIPSNKKQNIITFRAREDVLLLLKSCKNKSKTINQALRGYFKNENKPIPNT